MSIYVDTAMKTWEFEYRKDHEALKFKYDEMKELAKQILPKGVFNVSEKRYKKRFKLN